MKKFQIRMAEQKPTTLVLSTRGYTGAAACVNAATFGGDAGIARDRHVPGTSDWSPPTC